MIFTTGELVSLLQETGAFKIIRLENQKVILEDEHGFERSVDRKHLIKRTPFGGEVKIKDFAGVKKEVKNKSTPMPSIDLHAEALGIAHREPHDLLEAQILHCKAFLNRSIESRETKVLIIHGVGEGKLREAIRLLLHSKKGIQAHDGHYSARGIGSTLVEISISVVERF